MRDELSKDEHAMLVSALTDAVRGTGAAGLAVALEAVGWEECLQGAPVTAVSTVLRLQGALLTCDSVLDQVVLTAAGMSERADAVLYPALGAGRPTSVVTSTALRLEGVLDVTSAPTRLLVPACSGDTVVLAVVLMPSTSEPPLHAMDLQRSLVPVRVDVGHDDLQIVGDEAAWERARTAGLRALALELCGVTEAMLKLAVDHTTTRVQFGHPLAAFQAVKHKLADVRVWLECADLACACAFEDDDPVSAALAKNLAVRASKAARENCQQVLGGMGFTWEHPLHRYVRRALVLEPLLGSAAVLRADLGRDLLAAGQLPALATL